MKKFLILLLVALCASPFFVSANVDDDVWSYVFHLEYSNGTLSTQKGVYPYDPIPEQYISKIDSSTADYYGVIVSAKGVELARFGFSIPQKVLTAKKGTFDVRGPYFANASTVTYFTKAGTQLLDVSVKGSSFCNDNARCDADVGENEKNCPNDCGMSSSIPSAPPAIVAPMPAVTPPVTTPPDSQADGEQAKIPTMVIVVGAIGVFCLLLVVILWQVRKRKASEPLQ